MSDTVTIPEEWTVESAMAAMRQQDEANEESAADARAIVQLTDRKPSGGELGDAIKAALLAAERVCVMVRMEDDADISTIRCIDLALSYLLASVQDDLIDEYTDTGFVGLCEEFGVNPADVQRLVQNGEV